MGRAKYIWSCDVQGVSFPGIKTVRTIEWGRAGGIEASMAKRFDDAVVAKDRTNIISFSFISPLGLASLKHPEGTHSSVSQPWKFVVAAAKTVAVNT